MRRVRQNLFSYTHLEILAQVYRVNYLYIIYVIYICVWDRGQGDTVAHRVAGHIIHQSTWHTDTVFGGETLENMTEMMILICIVLAYKPRVQLRATNAASMKAQWARAAHALHTQRFCAAHTPLTLAV